MYICMFVIIYKYIYTNTNHLFLKPSKLDKQDMWDTGGEIKMNSKAMYSDGPLHAEDLVLDDQLEPINHSSVLIQDVTWKTYREWWTIETSGERWSDNPC